MIRHCVAPPRRRQRGVVVLLLLTVLLSAASYLLLRSLNLAEQRARGAQRATAASLAAAERALVGYALRYPEYSGSGSLTAGPGHLPCPDLRFDAGDVPGEADPPCARASSTETGRLPWRTLALPELRDRDGAPLWYAVDDRFRNNPQSPINPDVLATLRVDACGAGGRDVAALILAPGPPLGGQLRGPAAPNQLYAAADWLEGHNASRGDGCFSTLRNAAANDSLRVIDRARLLRRVQARVLADVVAALERYRRDPDGDDVAGVDPDCAPLGLPDDCDDAYPWLAPFADPTTAAYAGVPSTRAGLLPLRRVNVEFDAPFGAAWNLPTGGLLTQLGAQPPAPACVRSLFTACTVSPPGFAAPVTLVGSIFGNGVAPFDTGRCVWPGGAVLECTTRQQRIDPGSGARFTREYALRLEGLPRRIAAPDATRVRTEGVVLSATTVPAGGRLELTLTDRLLPAGGPETVLGSATLVHAAGAAVGQFVLSDVPFDLEVSDDAAIDPPSRRSPGELPAWFVANGWQRFVAVAYAAAFAPGSVPDDCTPGADCLRLERLRAGLPATTLDDVRGLVLGAGPALAGQARPSANPADYFEEQNASFDDLYTDRAADASFNDGVARLGVDE